MTMTMMRHPQGHAVSGQRHSAQRTAQPDNRAMQRVRSLQQCALHCCGMLLRLGGAELDCVAVVRVRADGMKVSDTLDTAKSQQGAVWAQHFQHGTTCHV